MARAVTERLEELRRRDGLREDDYYGGQLLGDLRGEVEPRLAKTGCGFTLVHYACQRGWLEFVQSLIQEHNSDPHARTRAEWTPLHYACQYGHFDVAHYLTSEQQCDSHAKTGDGGTPLHYACRHAHFDVVRYLTIEKHCDPDCCDINQQTPLHWLSGKNRVCTQEAAMKIVRFLISLGKCDVNKRDKDGSTALILACRREDTVLACCLITEGHCDVRIPDNDGDTALHVCHGNKTSEVSKLLLEEAKIDPNAKTNDGDTPLHLACRWENSTLVQLLVRDERCNPHEKNTKGDTALHVACCHTEDNISKFLLQEATINPSTKNNDGDTPLHLACRSGNSTLVQLLVRDERCNPYEKNDKGDTALHVACGLRRDDETLKLLLEEAKIDPNAKNNDGDTLLHLACRRRNSKLVQLLVRDERCHPHEKNSKGDTALHIASRLRWDGEIFKLLLVEAKIDPNAKNNDGDTPLHLACRRRNSSLVQLLVRDERCNPHEKNDKGDTALHVACRLRRDYGIFKLLLEEAKINPNAKNNDGDTLLHLACREWNSTLVQLLVRDDRCNPHEKNGKGDTALHVACRLRRDNEISKLLLEEAKIDPNTKNNDGDTPLHLACRELNSTLVQLLVRDERCNLNEKDVFGNSPQLLHWACRQHDKQLVQLIVRDERCNPHEKDSKGDTALHVACRVSWVTRDISKLLLKETNIDKNAKNNDGRTPLDLTSDPYVIRELIRHGANPEDVYKTHGKVLSNHSSRQPLETPVKMFIVGNPSAGKSTLTKALLSEAFGLKRIKKHIVKISGVNEKTAGIVPHEFESKIYGRVTLYDFAGQREFYGSHAALLQNAIQTSTPIFLLVVDLSSTNEDIKRNIFYWLAFLENQCTSVSSKPHLVAIGSHADILKLMGEDSKLKANFITSLLTTSQFPSLGFTGFVAMDCQYAHSAGMTELHRILKASCDSLRTQENINFNAHCFLVYLLDKFREATAITLAAIQARIEEDLDQTETSANDVKSFVPSNVHSLETICDQLNDRGHLLVLKNPTAIENSWVIINRTTLLAEINGTIFAPEGFKEHIKLASSTGVVPLSNITKHFPKHDLTMLVGFLSHLEFCHEISDVEIVGLISHEQVSTASEAASVQGERYFFFPGLVTLEVPSSVWEPQPQFAYHCGLILQCSQAEQFFGPRFLQILLLRLAFSFAFRKLPLTDVPSLQRKCSIWKNGIYWGDRNGVETLVEMAELNRVVVLMRCPETSSECLQLRSLLIQKVLAATREFCSKLSIIESFITPSDTTQYPLKPTSELMLYDITEVATAVAKGKRSVVQDTGTPFSLDSVLTFEPYADLGEPILRELFQEHHAHCNTTIAGQYISGIVLCISKKPQIFESMLQIDPLLLEERLSLHPSSSPLFRAREILNIWREQTEGTYQCLREKLDLFSVFAGRNPLEIAGVSCESHLQQPSVDGSAAVTPEIAPAMEHVVFPADVDMLAELLSEAAAHWDLFLGQIGLPSNVRDEIRNENSLKAKFSKRCLLEGLRRWVESEDRPTYGRITATLRGDTVCNIALARRVEGFAESRHSSEPC